MQQREKILAGVLAAIIAVLLGSRLVTTLVFQPIRERTAKLQSLEGRLMAQRKNVERLRVSQQKLELWRRRSLPSDPLNAQRLYQEWLDGLAVRTDLTQIRVTPERRTTKGAYVSVQVSLHAEASLANALKFLEQFDRTPLLHRIVRLEVGDAGSDLAGVQISLLAEGLALPDADDLPRLFPRLELVEPMQSSDQEVTVARTAEIPASLPARCLIGDEYIVVEEILGPGNWAVRRGVDDTYADFHAAGEWLEFAPQLNPADTQTALSPDRIASDELFFPSSPRRAKTPSQPAPPPLDAARFTFLVAAIETAEGRQAWLYDRSLDRRTMLREGTVFHVDGAPVRVVNIGTHEVVLRYEAANWRLSVGDNLRSMQRIAPERPPKLSLR